MQTEAKNNDFNKTITINFKKPEEIQEFISIFQTYTQVKGENSSKVVVIAQKITELLQEHFKKDINSNNNNELTFNVNENSENLKEQQQTTRLAQDNYTTLRKVEQTSRARFLQNEKEINLLKNGFKKIHKLEIDNKLLIEDRNELKERIVLLERSLKNIGKTLTKELR